MIDIAVEIIREYVQENLFDPTISWDKYEFKKRSYSHWAAYEILNRVIDHPLDAPLDTIENFMFEMTMYACCSENKQRILIFQTAAETAEEIALLII